MRPFLVNLGFYTYYVPAEYNSSFLAPLAKYSFKDYISSFIKILFLNVPEQLMRPLWFIGALFIAMLILKVTDVYIFIKMKSVFYQFIIVLAIYFCGYINFLPGFISQACVAVLFCWAGWKAHEYNVLETLFSLRISNKMLLFLFTFSIVSLASLKTDLIFMTNTYTSWWTMLISSFSGIIMMMLVCNYLEKTIFSSILSYIGQKTLYILPLHIITFKIISLFYIIVTDADMTLLASYPIITNDYPWWVLYSVAGIFFPLLIELLIGNIRKKV